MNESVFSVDQPEDSPGFLLWQTTITWQRSIKKALEPHGVSHTQFVLLAILLWHDKIQQIPTQVILANWSKLDKMTVSKSLRALVDQGFVKRHEHPNDTRAKAVQLTAEGKLLASKLVPIVERIDELFFSTLDGIKQKDLMAMLKALAAASTAQSEK
jgi:DNA-binding MarR family transcriptional regulator